jgi:hypothetical protein
MAYESKIKDIELIQGDSSDIWFFGLPDGSDLSGGDWNAVYAVLTDFGTTPIIERALPLNDGTGEGDSYPASTKFVFQITPDESALMESSTKYQVVVQVNNLTIPYRGEIAQFKAKIKPQGVTLV